MYIITCSNVDDIQSHNLSVPVTLGMKGTFSLHTIISFCSYCYKTHFAVQLWPIQASWPVFHSWAVKALLPSLGYGTSLAGSLCWLRSSHVCHQASHSASPMGSSYLAHPTANHITHQTHSPQQLWEPWVAAIISCFSNSILLEYPIYALSLDHLEAFTMLLRSMEPLTPATENLPGV